MIQTQILLVWDFQSPTPKSCTIHFITGEEIPNFIGIDNISHSLEIEKKVDIKNTNNL